MKQETSTPTDTEKIKTTEAERLARRVEFERELARLSARHVEDGTFATTAVIVVAAVAIAAVMAMLYVALR
jgi:hypothetical protein